MALENRLVEEMKQAMKSSDKLRLSTIRMIRTAVKNKEIEQRKPLDDEGIIRVIQGMVRKSEESVEQRILPIERTKVPPSSEPRRRAA